MKNLPQRAYHSNSSSNSGLVDVSLSNEDLPNKKYVRKLMKITTEALLGPIPNLDESIIEMIVRYLEIRDLHKCMMSSWSWFKICSDCLYGSVNFSQLSGARLLKFVETLQKTIVSKDGTRDTRLDYAKMVSKLTITHIVFEQDSPLQKWELVKVAIFLCSLNLQELHLSVGDESHLELPTNYQFLQIESLPALRKLELTSKSNVFPRGLVMELLDLCPGGLMRSIQIKNCLSDFELSGWAMIVQKGGLEIQELALTPSLGPNMLAWDEKNLIQGLNSIAAICSHLVKLDISGHNIMIPHELLKTLIQNTEDIEEFYMPCTSNDTHLFVFMNNRPWPKLRVLSLACHCIDGEKRDHMNRSSCNKFTDTVLERFLDHMMNVDREYFRVYLPKFLITVADGHRVDTLQYMSHYIHLTRRVGDDFWYKEKIILSIHTNRLIPFI